MSTVSDSPHPRRSPRRLNADRLQAAVEAIDRVGTMPMLTRLEEREPDVAEVVLEELAELHHQLYHMGLSPKAWSRFTRRLRWLCCTIVLTMRPHVAA